MLYRWNLLPPNKELQSFLSKELNISYPLAQLLINRDITTPKSALNFFFGDLKDLYDPFLMKGMDKSVKRLIKAIVEKEVICVYGDYDVDGVTGSSLIKTFFKEIGIEIYIYIPDRIKEGYGVNCSSIDKLVSMGVSLVITVDCGITSNEAIEKGNKYGIDFIVVDHHIPSSELPNAYAILNPKQKDCPFPFKELAGVGVAFNLLMGLRAKLREEGFFKDRPEPNLKRFLDLVALGTVADIVPIIDENRILVKFGLEEITHGKRIGIRALKEVSGLQDKRIDTYSIGFRLGPRINAAGRLGDAQNSVKLLTTEDLTEAITISNLLDQENKKRQDMEKAILDEVVSIIEKNESLKNSKSIVLVNHTWHSGVIGIVASRVVEMFYKPTILISLKDGIGKGSARSIPAFHIHKGLTECQYFFKAFGGHKMAAGITIEEEHISDFCKTFEEIVKKSTKEEDFIPEINIDVEVDFEDINNRLIEELTLLEPIGTSNPEPLFLCRNVLVKSSRAVGGNFDHLKMVLSKNGVKFDGIGFNMANKVENLDGKIIDIVFSLQINEYMGYRNIELLIKDFESYC